MNKALPLLLLFCAVAGASSFCDDFPHNDYVWESGYSPPARPTDTLLDNCQRLGLSNPALCNAISDSRLTIEQKKQLIVDDFVKNNGYPPFTEANAWNNGLAIAGYAPDGTYVRDGGNIRNAWVKILSISPAVIDGTENKTYVNATGKLRIAYNFKFVVPYRTFPEDCGTDYQICGYDYKLEAFNNGVSLNNQNQPFADFKVKEQVHNAKNDLSAVLTVKSQYLIRHYREVTECSEGGEGEEPVCVTTCEYSHTSDYRDSVRLTDTRSVYYYSFIAFQNAFIDSFNGESADGWLFLVSNEDFNNIKFTIANSSITLQSRQYQLKPELAPYNVLTPTFVANPDRVQIRQLSVLSRENKTLSGQEFDSFLKVSEPKLYYLLTQLLGVNLTSLNMKFYGDKIHFLAPAKQLACTVEINSHFAKTTITNACRYNANQKPVLNLTVVESSSSTFQASVRFYDNATNAPLTCKKIVFRYGSQNATVETGPNGVAQTSFNYLPGISTVSAEFLTDFETKSAKTYAVVPAKPPAFLNDIWWWITLAIILWLFYRALKRWFK